MSKEETETLVRILSLHYRNNIEQSNKCKRHSCRMDEHTHDRSERSIAGANRRGSMAVPKAVGAVIEERAGVGFNIAIFSVLFP